MDIFEAAEVGDYDAVCSLLQLKAKPEEHQNEVGFTALLAAANKGHDAIVERLLSAGVDIDYQTKTSGLPWIQHGATALMLASLQGHGKVVATLLANKAQVDLQSTNKNTSLILASIRGHTAVVELLIGASATIDMRVSLPRSATPASLERADGSAEEGRVRPEEEKKWDQRTDRMTFEVKTGKATKISVWTDSVRNAFRKQAGKAKLLDAYDKAAKHWTERVWYCKNQRWMQATRAGTEVGAPGTG